MADTKKTAATTEVKETKAQKFARLAPPRIQNAIDKINLIGNLSAKGGYEYTPEQVAKVKAALESAVSGVLARFSPDAKDTPNGGFTF